MKTKINRDIRRLARPNILKLKPYQSARQKACGKDLIFLDANENPFPGGYNRYPDPFQRELKMAIGKWKKISTNQIFLGNGSDEIIDLLIRTFCTPGKDEVIIPVPTYGMYEVCAQINDVRVIRVELDKSFQINTQRILKQGRQAKMIFICSPNNPTGNLIRKDLIYEILDHFRGIVVIDEAYIDFANDQGFISEIENYPNLVVLQTFSKAMGMAGIRLGMGFMQTDMVQLLNKIKYPYNISILNQNAALKAIEDRKNSLKVSGILRLKEKLIDDLQNLNSVNKIWPSDANFLLVKFKDHEEIDDFLKNEGIIIRNRSKEPNCEGCLRITVGNSVETESIIQKLKQFEQSKTNNYEKDIIS
ncbi:MAG: histidinol-phosphate transaminase [Bacteroidales bacterium]|jgi:histidinol-phosphate aminotransferase|nr:histidinol-phosphate transaminase [Bacteroidales bacterium]